MRHTVFKGILPTLLILIPIGVFLTAFMLFFMDQMTMADYAAQSLIKQSSLQEVTILKGDLCPNNKCMHLLFKDNETLEEHCIFINPPNLPLQLDHDACEHNELHVSALNRYLQEDKKDGLLNQ